MFNAYLKDNFYLNIASKTNEFANYLRSKLPKVGIEIVYPNPTNQIFCYLNYEWEFHQLLRANNEDQDLTRLNAFETMVERHYADCTLINAYVPEWPARMIDVGSGAGFPGIPLKLVNPHIRLTLCEPRPNRINFLNMVIEKMGLKGIDVFGHKVTSRSMTLPVDGVISRAS